MPCYSFYRDFNGADLFTVVNLPEQGKKFPIVLQRNPYVDQEAETPDEELAAAYYTQHKRMMDAGYAVVSQHCRGKGKSSGEFIPYINERADGLDLQQWAREQSFYNGELYLNGGSYTAAVHTITAPFAPDIKGAVIKVQDSDCYGCNYQNGFYKIGLHGGWYVSMYHKSGIKKKNYSEGVWNTLPLSDVPEMIFGEPAEDLSEILWHPDRNDPFWQTEQTGAESRVGVCHANIPILLMTGFYDIFTGGIFNLWNDMDEETRKQCALIVCPYDHSLTLNGQPIEFPEGAPETHFADPGLRWLEYIRGKVEAPVEPGKVTYYRMFENRWVTDGFAPTGKTLRIPLGTGERAYVYNPYDPTPFPFGVSRVFGGAKLQPKPDFRYDVLSFFSEPFERDTFVRGKMSAKLRVRSDCEDTCFYVRVSIEKGEGTYGLRDDIQQISNLDKHYVPGGEIEIPFSFDEHAFQIGKGERLRIDVASAAFPLYVRHTNTRGLYSEQRTAKIAHNTVICDRSALTIPIEDVTCDKGDGLGCAP